MERQEALALVTQLAIAVAEEYGYLFEPAGFAPTVLTNIFETHFNYDWPDTDHPHPIQPQIPITVGPIIQTDVCTRDPQLSQAQGACRHTAPHTLNPPPIITPSPFSTFPDVTGLARCGAATVRGYRCARRIQSPLLCVIYICVILEPIIIFLREEHWPLTPYIPRIRGIGLTYHTNLIVRAKRYAIFARRANLS